MVSDETELMREDSIESELANLEAIVRTARPKLSDLPNLEGIEISFDIIPKYRNLGGDHIAFLNFNKRYPLDKYIKEHSEKKNSAVVENLEKNKQRGGLLLADVSGHQNTDAAIAYALHHTFLMGAMNDIESYGEITLDLFEKVNLRLFNQFSSVEPRIIKLVTAIYGEIYQDGTFKFLSAGHDLPLVFSQEYQKLMDIGLDTTVNFPPLGLTPPEENYAGEIKERSFLKEKRNYDVSEIKLLGEGDIMFLSTDGIPDHLGDDYKPWLEDKLRKNSGLPAKEIGYALSGEIRSWQREDDMSYIVVKKDSKLN